MEMCMKLEQKQWREYRKTKQKKIFEDYIRSVDLKMSQDGIEVKLEATLYKYGITQKFRGDYEGNACQIIMENDKLQSEILTLNEKLRLRSLGLNTRWLMRTDRNILRNTPIVFYFKNVFQSFKSRAD